MHRVSPGESGSGLSGVSEGLKLLDAVTAQVPALLDAHLTVARCSLESGDLDTAQARLNQCLVINPQHSGTYLMLAQLHLSKDGFRAANR